MIARAMRYLDVPTMAVLEGAPSPSLSRFAGERAGRGASLSPRTPPQSPLSRETGEGRGGGLKGVVVAARSAARKWS